jgi:hypothetical protein
MGHEPPEAFEREHYTAPLLENERRLLDRLATLEADLAELRLRLAIWSGDDVPEGWTADADGTPHLRQRAGDRVVRLGYDGDEEPTAWWEGWRDRCGTFPTDGSRCPTVTAAKAEAEAWLANQKGGTS